MFSGRAGTTSVRMKVCLTNAMARGNVLIRITQEVKTIEAKTIVVIIPVGMIVKAPMLAVPV